MARSTSGLCALLHMGAAALQEGAGSTLSPRSSGWWPTRGAESGVGGPREPPTTLQALVVAASWIRSIWVDRWMGTAGESCRSQRRRLVLGHVEVPCLGRGHGATCAALSSALLQQPCFPGSLLPGGTGRRWGWVEAEQEEKGAGRVSASSGSRAGRRPGSCFDGATFESGLSCLQPRCPRCRREARAQEQTSPSSSRPGRCGRCSAQPQALGLWGWWQVMHRQGSPAEAPGPSQPEVSASGAGWGHGF